MQRFQQCCNDQDITEQDSMSEPMFFCCNCGTHHSTPIKETAEYLELETKYKELREAYIKLWADTENNDVGHNFFEHRETYRKLTKE